MIVKVLIDTGVKKLNKVYDYLVDENLTEKIAIGKRVLVNFGNGYGKEIEGVIVKIEENIDNQKENKVLKLKYIKEILDDVSYIDEAKLKLAKWMAKMYFCNVYTALRLMFPPTNNKKLSKKVLKENVIYAIELVDYNHIISDIEEKKVKSAKQVELLKFLVDNGQTLLSDISRKLMIKSYVVNTLIEKGYIKKVEVENINDEKANMIEKTNIVPNEEQKFIIDSLINKSNECAFNESLIYGVTGSRKNRSIFAANRCSNKKRENCNCFGARNIINATNKSEIYIKVW